MEPYPPLERPVGPASPDQFESELMALEKSGAMMPLSLSPRHAWYLFMLLQQSTSLIHAPPEVLEWAKKLAENIEARLCKTPAMKERARRAWSLEDTPVPEPKKKPEVTPQNKAVEPPENKAAEDKERKPPKKKRP